MNVIDMNEAETVGLVQRSEDFEDGFVALSVDPEFFIEFGERCVDLGWDEVTMHVKDDHLALAHEKDDDNGVYVALCPILPEEVLEGMRDE